MTELITIERVCPLCGQTHTITVREDGFDRWYYGWEYVQTAMPELSDTERESLLSGLCPSCQDLLFD